MNSPTIVRALIALGQAEDSLRIVRAELVANAASPVFVEVPYRSQHDQDAQAFRADCGPACAAMLLEWRGIHIPIDQLAHEAGISISHPMTNAMDLIAIAAKHGLILTRKVWVLLDDLEAEIRAGRPFMALINYRNLGENRQDVNYNSTHWVVVVGFDSKYVYINDPDYWSGRREEGWKHPVERDVFDWAWSDTLPNGQPRQVLTVV